MAGKQQVVYETKEIFTILAAHAMQNGKLPRGAPNTIISPHAKMTEDGELTVTITLNED